MRKTKKMSIKAGENLFAYFFDCPDKEPMKLKKKELISPYGFSVLGMYVNGFNFPLPFFTERNWYAAGYDNDDSCAIYLKQPWLLSRAIIFEYFRLERFGRIFIKQLTPEPTPLPGFTYIPGYGHMGEYSLVSKYYFLLGITDGPYPLMLPEPKIPS